MGADGNDIISHVNGPIHGTGYNISPNEVKGSLVNSNDDIEHTNMKDSEHSQTIHDMPRVYRQDVVMHRKSGAVGIVYAVADDSDSDTESSTIDEDNDDDEAEDDINEVSGDVDVGREPATEREDDNKDDDLPVPNDHARVLWFSDLEPIQHLKELVVTDRAFSHGDYVAFSSDPSGQMGVVVDINISVDLLAPDGSILRDVSSRCLRRVRQFCVGDFVVLDTWIGRVGYVFESVTVQLDDGSTCRLSGSDLHCLKPVARNNFDVHFPFYPGQRVTASSSSVFRRFRWLTGLWKGKRLDGSVTKIATSSVFVYWIACAGDGAEVAPPEEQSPKNLKHLSCFSHVNWQVGDWCYIPEDLRKESDKSLESGKCNLMDTCNATEKDTERHCIEADGSVHTPEALKQRTGLVDTATTCSPGSLHSSGSKTQSKESSSGFRFTRPKKMRKFSIRREKKGEKNIEEFERAFSIFNTRTTVDVLWQDGSKGLDLQSSSLVPVENFGDHEFVPGQYVIEKVPDIVDNTSEARRVAVIESVHTKDRTARVRWLEPIKGIGDRLKFDREEIVSVYQLEDHPDYDYSHGDIVIRLSQIISCENKRQFETSDTVKDTSFKKEEALSCGADLPVLSWVGHVTALKHGHIEVSWADGSVSKVGPQEIFVVSRDDGGSMADGLSDGAASWETVSEEELDMLENVPKENEQNSGDGIISEVEKNDSVNDSGKNSTSSLQTSLTGFISRMASGIFSRGIKRSHTSSLDSKGENECQPQEVMDISDGTCSTSDATVECGTNGSCSEPRSDDNDECDTSPLAVSTPFILNPKKPKSDISNRDCLFHHFDISRDPLDHHYCDLKLQNVNGRKWSKKIQKEWNILENNLPEGIFVRVYEDRMDLLRAAVVGAYGTPYQDGLFIFDVHLPAEYPDVPPSVYFHSGGWRINPNLYEDGKVCLSLLGTWAGRGNEVWDPASSSILQVLVSLQGLVLNANPYFNEAGYDKQIGSAEGEKNSLSYNENTFLLNCKMMMYLMRKPPKGFEELVKEHFRRRGCYILKACDAYMKGALIGSLTHDGTCSNNDHSNLTSVGFKLMLAKIAPKLLSALEGVGTNCHEFTHLFLTE